MCPSLVFTIGADVNRLRCNSAEESLLSRLEVFDASNKSYGRRRTCDQLNLNGIDCSEKLVRRVMAENNMGSCHTPEFKSLTKSDGAPVFDDQVNRDFTAAKPGERFVGDITEISTWEGKTYLATVIDLYNRKTVGYAIDQTYTAELVSDAIRMAKRNGLMKPAAVFHSDHGSQGGFKVSTQHL